MFCFGFFFFPFFPSLRFVSFRFDFAKRAKMFAAEEEEEEESGGFWGGLVVRMRESKDLVIYMYCRGGGPKPPPLSAYLLHDNLYRFRKLPRRNWVGGDHCQENL